MSGQFGRPLREIAADLQNGRLSAEALAEEAIDNHRRFDGPLQAYRTWDADRLRREAAAADLVSKANGLAGPLHGIPVSMKDLFGVPGYPTYAGTPKRLPESWERAGDLVRRLRAQSGLVTGKAHTVEFAFGALGTNRHFWGIPRNPWDAVQSRVPGGSSSGAGVSLLEGTALLAVGSDTGGSVRIPATLTGNAGIKTSTGRWATDGCVPLSPIMDTVGLLARSVDDLAFGFGALDPRLGDPYRFLADLERAEPSDFRVAVCENGVWDDCSPGVAEAARAAIDEFVAAGAKLVEIDMPEYTAGYAMHLKGSVVSGECDAFLNEHLPDWVATLDETVRLRIADGGGITAREWLQRKEELARLALAAADRLAGIDALIVPTAPVTPPTYDEVEDVEAHVRVNRQMFRNTCPVNMLGLCGLAVPAGLDAAGMPVGVTLVGRAMTEERLFAAAHAMERVIGRSADRLGRAPLGHD
ncbi:MAG: amidase [Rhodospirillaceae bacterium]|jgi:aspartyl-tRNA(Asn)/glutamyl-tRNA(Gln) amidotransferase subunit A|nr:amidase [Rhodospirillaceae bacterium]MBT6118432.1 amidase [Rhodospirillaceae bacterium]